jgi:hypothetical protein
MRLRKSGRIKAPLTARTTNTTVTDAAAIDTTATDNAWPAVVASSSGSVYAHSNTSSICDNSSITQQHVIPESQQQVQSAHDDQATTATATAATDNYKPQLLSNSEHNC